MNSTRTLRTTITFGVAALSLLTLSACSGTAGGGSATTRAKDPLAGLTGTPIRVMTIGNWTQPALGTSNPEFPAGAQAAAAAMNAAGGIDGRPIQVIVCSDELNADTARQCAQDAVDKKVVAVVGLQTTNEVTILPILQQAGIPAIGVSPFTEVGLTNPASFPDTSGFVGQTVGMGVQLAKTGATSVSAVVPGGLGGIATAVGDSVGKGAKSGGARYAGLVQIPAKSTDLSPTIAAATTGGASVAGFGSDEAAFITAMRSLAPDAKISTFPFNLTDSVISSAGSAANGVLAVDGLVPPSANTPGTKRYRKELAAFDPSMPTSTTGLHEWLAMWTFERVAAKLKSIDASGVMSAMNKLTDLDMGGITPNYTTTKAGVGYARMFNATVVFQEVKNGKLVLQHADDPFTDVSSLLSNAG